MAPPKRPWFRYYVETFTDMDFRALPYAHRLTWNAVMGLARSSPVAGVLLDKAGVPVTVVYLADFAAVKLAEAKAALVQFTALGWVTVGDAVVVTNWDKRQFESDDVATRVARHRGRNADVTPDVTVMERPSLTGTEVQRTELVTSVRVQPLVGAERARSLLSRRRTEDEIAELVTILDDLERTHGVEAVAAAVESVQGVYSWPSDAERALLSVLGPAPVEAKPHPLDEAQRAQYTAAEGGLGHVREVLADCEEDPEVRRLKVAEMRAAREGARESGDAA